jgi:hypothetical protein
MLPPGGDAFTGWAASRFYPRDITGPKSRNALFEKCHSTAFVPSVPDTSEWQGNVGTHRILDFNYSGIL